MVHRLLDQYRDVSSAICVLREAQKISQDGSVRMMTSVSQFIAANYTPLHPALRTQGGLQLCHELSEALSGTQDDKLGFMQQLHPGIYAFPCFPPHVCARLLEEVG